MKSEVLIIGGGPAAYSAAIRLRQLGRQVVLVHRDTPASATFGESLPGSVKRSLRRLGLWQCFLEDGHFPCYSNLSAWGSGILVAYSFIESVHGHGWHIHRPLFEYRMREKARQLGIVEKAAGTGMCLRQSAAGQWELSCGDQRVVSSFIIDASGRNSWVGRQLKIGRIIESRQVGLVSFFTPGTPLPDLRSSLVESGPLGWWYLAYIPGNRFVCIYFTDLGLVNIQDPTATMKEMLDQTVHIRRFQNKYCSTCPGPVKIIRAEDSHLSQFCGERWMAVGDAAISYHPLSSHGISFALSSGCDGAEHVHACLDSRSDAMRNYSDRLTKAYAAYTSELGSHLAAEKRWPESAYWAKYLQ